MADDNGGNEAKTAADQFNEQVTGPAMRAAEAMQASGRRIAEGGATISTKLIDQAETNASQAFAAMRAAAAAKDLTEVMRIQSDYLRDQTDRAMIQARELGDLIAQYGKAATTPPGEGRD